MPENRYDFFLSFAGPDIELANQIYQALTRERLGEAAYKVCYQPVDFPLGSQFTEKIHEALSNSKTVIAVLTPNYFATSMWTRAEFDAALLAGKLLMFCFDRATVPGYAMTTAYQYFDVRPGETGFVELIRSAARLQPIPTQNLEKRIDLIRNMPGWKGSHHALIGRENELQQLTDAIRDPDCAAVCVIADGGFGKSSLVKQWIDQIRDNPSVESYLGLQAGFAYSFYTQGWEGNSAISSTPFFEEGLSFLSGVDRGRLPEGGPGRWAGDLFEILDRRRSLLIMDGLEPHQWPKGTEFEGEIRDKTLKAFIGRIVTKRAGGLCVITSRVMPAELSGPPVASGRVRVIELKALSIEASRSVLRSSGIGPDDPNLEYWAQQCGGHPLLLALLAPAIVEHHYDRNAFESHRVLTEGGNRNFPQTIRRFVLSHLPSLGEEAQAVLQSVCLFDRPVQFDELRRLLLERALIPRITAPLYSPSFLPWARRFSEKRFAAGLRLLRSAAMLTVGDSDADPVSNQPIFSGKLEVHPLIQAGIRSNLIEREKPIWRKANWTIYRSLVSSVKRWRPDTKEELLRLYAAVPHGINAGQGKRAGWMYALRCLHGFNGYSTNFHGMISDDIAALSHYFEGHWQTLKEDIGMNNYARIHAYGWSGSLLTGIDRGQEGRPLMKRAMELAIQSHNYTTGARVARNLGMACAVNGSLSEGESYLRQSVELLERRRPFGVRLIERGLLSFPFQRMAARATLASMLHYQARFEEAEATFQDAAACQEGHGSTEPLKHIWAFRQVEFLLDMGRLEEADELVAVMEKQESPAGQGEGVFTLPVPLPRLAFVRARIRRADFQGEKREWDRVTQYAGEFSKMSVEDQRLRVGWLVPLMWIALSGVARLSGNCMGASQPIEEADRRVTQAGNRLYASDVCIERARIYLADSRKTEAAKCIRTADALVEGIGYRCKAGELARLSEGIG